MKKLSKTLVATLAISLAPFMVNAGKESKNEYIANMQALNDSGVWAEVEMKLKGNTLKVEIEASGLEAGKPHPQHIHGFGDATKNATCPGFEADVDGDGVISVGEGAPFYGPIVLPLVPFDLVDESGNLEYEIKLTFNPQSLGDLSNRTVVMHGMTVNGTYVPSLPVACGQLELEAED